jgi:allantoin racemase
MSRIAILNPNSTAEMTREIVRAAAGAARPGTEVAGVTALDGPAVVETNAHEALAARAVLTEVDRAEGAAGAPDAWVIACFGDTGLAVARERASGPVVGMTEAALMTAALVAARFTLITMPRRTRAMSERVVRELGLDHRCTIRAVDEPVAAVTGGSAHLLPVFVVEGRAALEQDAAEAIVLGCAGLAELAEPLTAELGVPVVEGVAAGVAFAEALLAQGIRTSRASTWEPAS